MKLDTLTLLVAIHHQLVTDSDLETVTAPHKYRALVRHIEQALQGTQYSYLCTHLDEEAAA